MIYWCTESTTYSFTERKTDVSNAYLYIRDKIINDDDGSALKEISTVQLLV